MFFSTFCHGSSLGLTWTCTIVVDCMTCTTKDIFKRQGVWGRDGKKIALKWLLEKNLKLLTLHILISLTLKEDLIFLVSSNSVASSFCVKCSHGSTSRTWRNGELPVFEIWFPQHRWHVSEYIGFFIFREAVIYHFQRVWRILHLQYSPCIEGILVPHVTHIPTLDPEFLQYLCQ